MEYNAILDSIRLKEVEYHTGASAIPFITAATSLKSTAVARECALHDRAPRNKPPGSKAVSVFHCVTAIAWRLCVKCTVHSYNLQESIRG